MPSAIVHRSDQGSCKGGPQKRRFSPKCDIITKDKLQWYWIISQKMNRKVFSGIYILTQFHQYDPPRWAASLKYTPQHFVKVRYLIKCFKYGAGGEFSEHDL